jgi:hypothetical protein
MRWVTRRGVHIDRAACAWLLRRFVDTEAEFVFVSDPVEVPDGATPFDMRGVALGHQGPDCTFETILRRYDLDDPVLWKLAEAVHEADLETTGSTHRRRRAWMRSCVGCRWTLDDSAVLAVSGPMFDGLYEYFRRATLLGRTPA